jgi:hypothetical protein
MRNSCRILVANPDEKRQFGRCRRRWEDNINIGAEIIGCDHVNWIRLI